MIWLTPDGEYLVQGPGAVLPDWAAVVRGLNGESVGPAKFYLVTPAGDVSQAFSEPLEYTVDDERGLSNIHAVSGDSLVSYHVIEHLSLGQRIVSRVVVAGLTPAEAGSAPSSLSGVIAAYEEREHAERQRRRNKDAQEWRALREALDRLRAAIEGEAGRLEATWQFEPGGWVVRRGDGSVLVRGPTWGYGRDVYRQIEAVLRERLGENFALAVRLEPGEEWAFYSD
jgi:hypothetical protein